MSTLYETGDELLAEADRRRRIQSLNDALRSKLTSPGVHLGENELVVTRGLAEQGTAFMEEALAAVSEYADFSEDNDPCGEHDFGAINLEPLKVY